MRIIVFVLLITCIRAYNTTQDILHMAQNVCMKHKHYSCYYDNEILVLDWKADQPKNVLWNFNEHARELITGELAFHMIHQIPKLNPSKRITIIPVMNVWGRTVAMESNPCQRKNKNSVDPNRNFWTPTNHRKYRKSSEEYEGRTPISEPESILLDKLLRNMKRYVNVHSGEYSLYMPHDSSFSKVKNYKTMNDNIHRYAKFCPECTVGPAAVKSFYRAFGTSADWAIEIGVPEAYTFEIFGRETYNCFKMFNPDDMTETLEKWEKILLLTIN